MCIDEELGIATIETIGTVFKESSICIPRIQRDYAQGRRDKFYVREGFLKNVFEAISEDKKLSVDFIYGYKEDDVFYPLDGQQRLTSLWLIYWYLVVRSGELETECECLSHFSYETRSSSSEFCSEMCKIENIKKLRSGQDIIELIIDQPWFFTEWLKDPTISAMLVTIGGTGRNDGIQPIFSCVEDTGWKECLDKFKNNIVFYKFVIGCDFLPKEAADQLYIKMNARGKALSDFENFRADLIDVLNKRCEGDGELQKGINDISKRLDYEWSSIFWENIKLYLSNLKQSKAINSTQVDYDKKAASNLENKIGLNTDELFFSFINRFCFVQLCIVHDKVDYRLNTSLISLIDALQDPEEESKLNDKRRKLLRWIKEESDEESKLIKTVLNQYDYFFDDHSISYEKYDYYEAVLVSNEQNIGFDKLKKVLDALSKKTHENKTWSVFIQEEIEKIVNVHLRARQPNSTGYRFLPQYRRKPIMDDKNVKTLFYGNIMTRRNKGGSTIGIIETIQLKDRLYFFAICKYLEVNGEQLNINSFEDWLYFCRNIIENAGISSIKAMIDCMRLLDKYGNHSVDILQYLHDLKNDDSKKAEIGFEGFSYEKLSYIHAQIAEEVQKAFKIMEHEDQRRDDIKRLIRKTEDYSVFCGSIRFLFLDDNRNEDWGENEDNFKKRLNRAEKVFIDGKNAVNYDFVKKFDALFKDYEDASEKYIFHVKGWAERGDSWLDVFCDYDCRKQVNKWLLGNEISVARDRFNSFVSSDAFETIVKKNKVLESKGDMRITRKDEHWVCVRKSSPKDMLIFDDDDFHRNEHLSKLETKYKLVNDRYPFLINDSIKIGEGYYWYKDVYFMNDSEDIFVYNSEGKIYKIHRDGNLDKEYIFNETQNDIEPI